MNEDAGLRAAYVRGRRVPDEMVSRGPWTTEVVQRYVSGFYHFAQQGIRLNERCYDEMREADPGLPEWSEFTRLLEGSDYLAAVVVEPTN